MMKKIEHKVKKSNLEHVVDWDTFITDDEMRKKYCKIEIDKITNKPYNIMDLDDFIKFEDEWKKELKREEID